METLKIVHIDLIPKLNGGHVAITNLVKALAKEGHEVQLILNTPNISDKKFEKVIELNGTNYMIHYLHGYGSPLNLYKFFQSTIKKLIKLNDQYIFDIIHAHTVGGFSVTLSNKEDLTSKFILTLHGNQLYRALMLLSDVSKNPKFLIKPNYMVNMTWNLIGALIYNGLEIHASKKAVITTVPSEFDKNIMIKMKQGNEDNIVVVPNCLDYTYSNMKSKISIKHGRNVESEPTIFFSGALSPLKGVHYLLDAMRYVTEAIPSTKLIIAGKGMLQDQVNKYKKNSGNSNIISYGWVPHEEMYKLYTTADILAHPSLYESCSLTIAEALSLGVPVVAFNTSGIPEYVAHGVTGMLAELGDSRDLASKIIQIISNDKLARKMSKKGREFAENTFSPEVVAKEILSIYKYVI